MTLPCCHQNSWAKQKCCSQFRALTSALSKVLGLKWTAGFALSSKLNMWPQKCSCRCKSLQPWLSLLLMSRGRVTKQHLNSRGFGDVQKTRGCPHGFNHMCTCLYLGYSAAHSQFYDLEVAVRDILASTRLSHTGQTGKNSKNLLKSVPLKTPWPPLGNYVTLS